jgi:hypothetical protein
MSVFDTHSHISFFFEHLPTLVSRSHQNQAFQVLVGPDVGRHPLDGDIGHALSPPITVRSKRNNRKRNTAFEDSVSHTASTAAAAEAMMAVADGGSGGGGDDSFRPLSRSRPHPTHKHSFAGALHSEETMHATSRGAGAASAASAFPSPSVPTHLLPLSLSSALGGCAQRDMSGGGGQREAAHTNCSAQPPSVQGALTNVLGWIDRVLRTAQTIKWEPIGYG